MKADLYRFMAYLFINWEFGSCRLFSILRWTEQTGYLRSLDARVLLLDATQPTRTSRRPRLYALHDLDFLYSHHRESGLGRRFIGIGGREQGLRRMVAMQVHRSLSLIVSDAV